jgi:hypothetical protein
MIITKGFETILVFWDLVFKEKERYHLPHQFNQNFYDQIEKFQGERSVTSPLHSKDINIDGDEICKPTITQVAQETQNENEDFKS